MDQCYHCGDACDATIEYDEKPFCCVGCRTVYQILSDHGMDHYYSFADTPGISPNATAQKFEYLDNPEIIDQLVEFSEGTYQVFTLHIPTIHCSSCIWVLENLNKLDPGVKMTVVNFPKKTLQLGINSDRTSFKNIVQLLSSLGYEPLISLDDVNAKPKRTNHSLIYKLGVAGFAFWKCHVLVIPRVL